jgi:L-iditol 2-dehydrogenase
MKILEFLGPWQMTLLEAPEPQPGPSELLIKSMAVGICGSDVHGFTGESGRRKPGMVMGHEVVGEIVALGPGVTSFAVGQRVVIFPTLGCRQCAVCKRGGEHICPNKKVLGVNAGRWGAMAGFFTANVCQAFPLSSQTDPNLGLFAEPLGVAIRAIKLMNPAPGSVIAVVGSGTIGLALALTLRHKGFNKVYVLDKIDEKLALARQFGAIPINVDKQSPADFIAQRTGSSRVPCVFEAVGAAATVRAAYELCDFGGTVVLVGNLAKEFTLPLQGVVSNEITLRGSSGFDHQDFREAVALVEKIPGALQNFVSGFCSLEETPAVMTQMAKSERQAIKIIIRP